MGDHSEVFVAFDTSKLRNSVAIAEAGRTGEVRFFGEIDNTPAATEKLVRKLAAKYRRLTFCYEAGPTGYGLYRQIKALGHECVVAAPSLIPKKPGDRVKTNRRDALNLAKLLRAGELTAVWVPDARHEAMRDLVRARGAAVDDLKSKRQQILSLLLRLGRHYQGKKTWTRAHMIWLVSQKLAHREQRIALEEMLLAVRQAQERVVRLDAVIVAAVPDWSLAKVVTALMAAVVRASCGARIICAMFQAVANPKPAAVMYTMPSIGSSNSSDRYTVKRTTMYFETSCAGASTRNAATASVNPQRGSVPHVGTLNSASVTNPATGAATSAPSRNTPIT